MDIGRRRWGVPLVALGMAAMFAVGGCSADNDSTSSRATDGTAGGSVPRAVPTAAADGESGRSTDREAPGGQTGADPSSGGAGGADLRVDQRLIIYTGSLRVQVDDVDQAARDAIALATGAGGFVGGDERRGVAENARAELRLRVPATRFTEVVDGLAQLGQQQRREVHTEDVTEETIDLDARIATQRARVESARKLLARASSISDLITLENELGRREADLASLEAKKRRLADLTALSTVTVTLVGRGALAQDADEPGFLSGLADAGEAFRDSVVVLVTVVAALLPWLLLIAVPVVLFGRWLRRRPARRPVPPVGPYAPGPPSGVPAAYGVRPTAPVPAGAQPTVPAPRAAGDVPVAAPRPDGDRGGSAPGPDGGDAAPAPRTDGDRADPAPRTDGAGPAGGTQPPAGSGSDGQLSEPPPAPAGPSAP